MPIEAPKREEPQLKVNSDLEKRIREAEKLKPQTNLVRITPEHPQPSLGDPRRSQRPSF
jgi:hypothetical protein